MDYELIDHGIMIHAPQQLVRIHQVEIKLSKLHETHDLLLFLYRIWMDRQREENIDRWMVI